MNLKFLSIHPSAAVGSRLSRMFQMSFSPGRRSSFSWVIPRRSQARWDIWSLGLPHGLLPVGHALKTSEGSRPQHPNQQSTSAGSLWHEGAPSGCLSSSPYISKAEPSHSTGETNFGRLYPWSHSFSHYPKVMTVGEGWNIDGLVNHKLCHPAQLPLHHGSLSQRLQCCWLSLSISHSTLPSINPP